MSKTRRSVVLALIAVLGPARAEDFAGRGSHGAEAKATSPRDLLPPDGIDWATVQALQTAGAEATRRGVAPEACRIRVVEWRDRLVVLFGNATDSVEWRGCPPGPCECFEVEVTRDGRRVLRAAFTR